MNWLGTVGVNGRSLAGGQGYAGRKQTRRLPPPTPTPTPTHPHTHPHTRTHAPSAPSPWQPALCSFCSQEEDPLLWASTYEAGSVLQQLAATALGGAPGGANGGSGGSAQAAGGAVGAAAAAATAQRLLARYGCPPPPGWLAGDSRKAAVGGYKVQSCRVLEHVDRLLAGCEARRQSVVIEGVHLSLRCVVRHLL